MSEGLVPVWARVDIKVGELAGWYDPETNEIRLVTNLDVLALVNVKEITEVASGTPLATERTPILKEATPEWRNEHLKPE